MHHCRFLVTTSHRHVLRYNVCVSQVVDPSQGVPSVYLTTISTCTGRTERSVVNGPRALEQATYTAFRTPVQVASRWHDVKAFTDSQETDGLDCQARERERAYLPTARH